MSLTYYLYYTAKSLLSGCYSVGGGCSHRQSHERVKFLWVWKNRKILSLLGWRGPLVMCLFEAKTPVNIPRNSWLPASCCCDWHRVAEEHVPTLQSLALFGGWFGPRVPASMWRTWLVGSTRAKTIPSMGLYGASLWDYVMDCTVILLHSTHCVCCVVVR